MLVKDSEQKTGNDRYEGYNLDMVESISQILGFNYTIRIVEDGNYGGYDSTTDTWNGMIGELLSQAILLIMITNLRIQNKAGIYGMYNSILNLFFPCRKRILPLEI